MKSEGRRPKPERRPKSEIRNPKIAAESLSVFADFCDAENAWQHQVKVSRIFRAFSFAFRISVFGLLSDFGLRVSDFGKSPLP